MIKKDANQSDDCCLPIIQNMQVFCRFLFVILFLFFSNFIHSQTISCQQQFDEALNKLKNGENVSIELLPGVYKLSNSISTKSSLSIIGQDATIISYSDSYENVDYEYETFSHYVCKLKTKLNDFSLLLDQNNSIVDVSESVDEKTRVNKVLVIECDYGRKAGVKVQLPISDNLSHLKNRSFEKAFGYFDCGWTRVNIRILKSDDRYFYCETLHKCYGPQFDFEETKYHKDIRFVIYNAEIKPNTVY